MTVIEITLLVIGAVIFIASFIIPERGKQRSGVSMAKVDDMVKKAIEKEIPSIQNSIKATVDETVEYAIEKTERSMSKVSNEKIMAVNEYANTIIEEMNKDHQEVMFLYDMLNEKQIDIKNTINKIHATKSEVEDAMNQLQEQLHEQYQMQTGREHTVNSRQSTEKSNSKTNSQVKGSASNRTNSKSERSLNRDLSRELGREANKDSNKASNKNSEQGIERDYKDGFTSLSPKKHFASFSLEQKGESSVLADREQKADRTQKNERRLQEDRRGNAKTEINNNQRILQLKNDGKTNVEIAQILGLGLGEVKLVIDLFEGASS